MRVSTFLGVLMMALSLVLAGCGGKSEEQQIEDEIVALDKEIKAMGAGAATDPGAALAAAGKMMEKTMSIGARIAKLPPDKQKALSEKLSKIGKG